MNPREIAADTIEILERCAYINNEGKTINFAAEQSACVKGTKLYTPDELAGLAAKPYDGQTFETIFETVNETTFDAARRLITEGEQNILCLNFASAKNPGGGFLRGAVSQEECLARASGLYPSLQQCMSYYNDHRAEGTCLYSDRMIYSPNVPIFKFEDGSRMNEFVLTSIVTSPATNAGAIQDNEPESIRQIPSVMRTRTEKMLALCAAEGHQVLVLGAWGCGVFRNDPVMIAGIFEDLLKGKFAHQFKRIVFAVKTKSDDMLQAFSSKF